MVEYRLPKPGVVGSSPIARSIFSLEALSMKTWHLIVEDAPWPGPWNMAVDEYLFRLRRREPRTFLRFYRWERPTASLGAIPRTPPGWSTSISAAPTGSTSSGG